MRLVWSERSVKDLSAIGDYIARDNPSAARAHVRKLAQAARRAGRYPRSGRIVPEVGDSSLREFILGNYRIVYRIEEQCVLVVTVFEAHHQPAVDLG